MTYPAGPAGTTNSSGISTNNYGPFCINWQAATIVNQINIEPTATSPATYNFTHSITSTQEDINSTLNVIPQQGSAAISNTSSIVVAGVNARDLAVFKWQ